MLGFLKAQLQGYDPVPGPWMIGSLVAVVAICIAATIVPIRLGLKRVEGMEF